MKAMNRNVIARLQLILYDKLIKKKRMCSLLNVLLIYVISKEFRTEIVDNATRLPHKQEISFD
jgi:hypothetical protein